MKKLFTLLVICLLSNYVFAQEFRHGVGTGFLVQVPEGDAGEVLPTLLYYPRVCFPMSSGKTSISLGVPLTFGIAASWGESGNSASFAFNAPVTAEFNFGAGAIKNSGRRFGFFVGAGFGYHYATYSEDSDYWGGEAYDYSESAAGVGPAADAGVRFKVGNRNRNIEIRTSYMRTVSDNVYDVFGLNCLFNF
ncbi:hypothetical protein SAMN05444266_11271 [Chitinophaga jiangningensis]|uniref:Outer membrane protein beta-barrel domain-containing protein n=1 Tax=Chitinophaga jiangningensis TaxID=1419482 RepID=A0A1M7M532_9BACT|nr:hypothetical protein [Chitinophaga jiangningensis]SHM85796.1 hypothetical protein SAMN05444266_11271 [Chitinophaga jiangningensis]